MELFKNLFGGKPWTQSLTAWGLVIFLAGEAALDQACGAGLIGDSACGVMSTWVQNIGVALTALGIRRAAA